MTTVFGKMRRTVGDIPNKKRDKEEGTKAEMRLTHP